MARGRRSKADKAEVRRADPSQMPLISEDKLVYHMNTVQGYDDKINTYSARRRSHDKAIKADGIDPRVVRDLIKLKRRDPLEYRNYLTQMGVGFKVTGQPFQIGIFDTAFGSPEEQARAEGAQAGRAGRGPECRWPEGSPPHSAYIGAYQLAQARMVPGASELSDEEIRDASNPDHFAEVT